MKKISKTDAEKEIEEFFKNIQGKSPKEIKKIKKFAMSYNIALGDLKKKFCKKCYSVFRKPKIRIRKGLKIVECENCGFASRWKL